MLVQFVSLNESQVAGDLQQAATSLAKAVFGGINQRPTDAPAAYLSFDHQCGDATDRLRPVKHLHLMQVPFRESATHYHPKQPSSVAQYRLPVDVLKSRKQPWMTRPCVEPAN